MLQIIENFSTVAFNTISVLAIVGSAWWFINRGALRSNLEINLSERKIKKFSDVSKFELVIDVKNIGSRDAWIKQILLSLEYIDNINIPTGPIPTETKNETIILNGQSSDIAAVPSSTISFRFILDLPEDNQIIIARYYIFPGRGKMNIKNNNELKIAIKNSGDNYYLGEIILDV
ncbi:hypothetical protein [Thalassospira xiamenensis]|uniref:hypothetical protein n=1 Tax=Thalassospira xiamenensis TaxID=220697 RepID=UPI0011BE76DF|nr:hypothetical protein [Thalassospira xiamenensis]